MIPGRRAALAALGVGALGGAAWRFWPAPAIAFSPSPVPGFRMARLGGSSAVIDPFAGLGEAFGPQADPDARAAVAADPCAALFGADPAQSGRLRVALLTDYRCPNCRALDAALAAAARDDGAVDIVWLDWPILGRASLQAARAAMAADLQGGRAGMHERLLRSAFEPNAAWLDAVAATLGLDAARLRLDMTGPVIAARLSRTAALARLFGFRGTPALVAGRTAMEGAAPRRSLAALFALERATPGARCG